MDLLHTLLLISQAEEPTDAFNAMVSALGSTLSLKSAAYVREGDRKPRDLWPPETELTDDLIDTALHIIRPEAFPLGSEFPFEASTFPDSELLFLPLHRKEGQRATCVLIGGTGVFGSDLAPWEQLAATLEAVERRHERLKNAEANCDELRRRVEESEALHTLGLAAHRTLDLEEVLNLVARFTRTLLGAQYVTVSTTKGGVPETVASVGLRNVASAEEDRHLARCVAEAEKPLTIGGEGSNLQVENFPFHAREGMQVGVGLPLSLFGDTFGALVVGYRSVTSITSRDIRLALTLAGHAAVAIANARLHERVEQRSVELEAANDELNRVTVAKERFFASINHELRNPLGAIIGYHTLIEDNFAAELPSKGAEYLKKANRAAETLRALINDLLDLSKLAAGKMEMDLQPVSLGSVAEQALDTIQPLAASKGITLVCPPRDEWPTITTDAQRVQQILVNLLSNAVKFSDGGEVRVEMSLVEPTEGEGSSEPEPPGVEVSVRDNGPGIAEANLSRVFEEFEQVEGTTGGTGLGLPISRRLARLLGGDLVADSTLGKGSTFTLRLPVTPAPIEEHTSDRVVPVA